MKEPKFSQKSKRNPIGREETESFNWNSMILSFASHWTKEKKKILIFRRHARNKELGDITVEGGSLEQEKKMDLLNSFSFASSFCDFFSLFKSSSLYNVCVLFSDIFKWESVLEEDDPLFSYKHEIEIFHQRFLCSVVSICSAVFWLTYCAKLSQVD